MKNISNLKIYKFYKIINLKNLYQFAALYNILKIDKGRSFIYIYIACAWIAFVSLSLLSSAPSCSLIPFHKLSQETAFPTSSCVTSHALCACVMRVKQRSKATRYNRSRKAAGISQFSRLFNHFHSRRRRALSQYRTARFALMTKKMHSNKRIPFPLRAPYFYSLLFSVRNDDEFRWSWIKITNCQFSANIIYAITRCTKLKNTRALVSQRIRWKLSRSLCDRLQRAHRPSKQG